MSSKQQAPPAPQVKITVCDSWYEKTDATTYGSLRSADLHLMQSWVLRHSEAMYRLEFEFSDEKIESRWKHFRDDVPPSVMDEMDMMIESLQHAAKALRETDKEAGSAKV